MIRINEAFEPLNEMSQKKVGSLNSTYKVQVVPETLKNHTFHFICMDSKRKFKAIIEIETLKLLKFENTPNKNKYFTRKEKQMLVEWLENKPYYTEIESGWKWLLNAWNDNNFDDPISIHLNMPNIDIPSFLEL